MTPSAPTVLSPWLAYELMRQAVRQGDHRGALLAAAAINRWARERPGEARFVKRAWLANAVAVERAARRRLADEGVVIKEANES